MPTSPLPTTLLGFLKWLECLEVGFRELFRGFVSPTQFMEDCAILCDSHEHFLQIETILSFLHNHSHPQSNAINYKFKTWIGSLFCLKTSYHIYIIFMWILLFRRLNMEPAVIRWYLWEIKQFTYIIFLFALYLINPVCCGRNSETCQVQESTDMLTNLVSVLSNFPDTGFNMKIKINIQSPAIFIDLILYRRLQKSTLKVTIC